MDVLTHFGLNQIPFSEEVTANSYYRSAEHAKAILSAQSKLHDSVTFMRISSESGYGKSVVARQIAEGLSPDQFVVSIVHQDYSASQSNIEHTLNATFGSSIPSEIVSSLDGSKAVVIVDTENGTEAQDFLNSLSEAGIAVVLLDQSEDADITLTNWEAASIARLIVHRLKAAGAQRSIFSKDAIKSIVAAAEGSPGKAMALCRESLRIAHLRQLDEIPGDMVEALSQLDSSSIGSGVPELVPADQSQSFENSSTELTEDSGEESDDSDDDILNELVDSAESNLDADVEADLEPEMDPDLSEFDDLLEESKSTDTQATNDLNDIDDFAILEDEEDEVGSNDLDNVETIDDSLEEADDDLDDLLGDLDEVSSEVSEQPEDDLDDLLEGFGDDSTPQEDDLAATFEESGDSQESDDENLDGLLNEIEATEESSDEEDLDSLLQGFGDDTESDVSSEDLEAEESEDLDDLLGDFGDTAEDLAAEQSEDDDLDDLLDGFDDLEDNSEPAHDPNEDSLVIDAFEPAQNELHAEVVEEEESDIDSMLSDWENDAEDQSEEQISVVEDTVLGDEEKSDDLDAELDDLLSEFDGL